MLYPLVFHPIYRQRVWGGRRLASHFGRTLPPDIPIGESWEIADRPDAESVVANGPLAGRTLRWLMEQHAPALLGEAGAHSVDGRFPLLVKILDAQESLSLQVHPPATLAASLGGESKAEAWHVVHAQDGARIYAGLRAPETRASLEAAAREGRIAGRVQSLPAKAGDSLFIPPGRVHALGAGVMVFEVQQNSDTTYRLFDWNRTGNDGRPRDLHVAQALACLRYDDVTPALSMHPPEAAHHVIVDEPGLFYTHLHRLSPGGAWQNPRPGMVVVGVANGRLRLSHPVAELALAPGQFALVPASLPSTQIHAEGEAVFLTAGLA